MGRLEAVEQSSGIAIVSTVHALCRRNLHVEDVWTHLAATGQRLIRSTVQQARLYP